MKKVLASLFAVYALNNAQTPPFPAQVQAQTTAPPVVPVSQTTASAIPPVAAQTTAAAVPPAATAAAPGTTVASNPIVPPIIPPAVVETTVAPQVPAATTSAPVTAQTTAAAAVPQTTARLVSQTTLAAAAVTTAAPVVPVVTTAAPAPTLSPSPPINMLCPIGSGLGRPNGLASQDKACTIPGQIAQDFQGVVRCNDFSCCHCEHITCGYAGMPCEAAQFGDNGAIGVQSIWVDGKFTGNGATLECDGRQSCKKAKITANYLWKGSCGGDLSCEGATIDIYNPALMLEFSLNGHSALRDGELNIIIGEQGTVCPSGVATAAPIELQKIDINGFQAALNAKIAIRNYGCAPVIIRSLECLTLEACPNTEFILEGNIAIEQCALRGIQNAAALPTQLQACAAPGGFGGFFPGQLPGGQLPGLFPPAQQLPGTPVTPPVAQPPVQQTPVTPPANPVGPVIPPALPSHGIPQSPVLLLAPGSSGKLNCDGVHSICSGQSITMGIQSNWVLECPLPNSCAGMTLNVEVGIDPHTGIPVEQIDSLKFVGYGSGQGTTINLIDARPTIPGVALAMLPVHIGDLRCENPGSCVGLTINADPTIAVRGMNLDCSEPMYCTGCSVHQNGASWDCAAPLPFYGQYPQQYGGQYGGQYAYGGQPQQQPQQQIFPGQQGTPFVDYVGGQQGGAFGPYAGAAWI